MQQEIFAV